MWLHPNATRHIAEYADAMLDRGVGQQMVDLLTQMLLTSLQQAVRAATAQGIPYGQDVREGDWELEFSPPRHPGQLPVLMHAVPIR